MLSPEQIKDAVTEFENSSEHRIAMAVTNLTNAVSELEQLSKDNTITPQDANDIERAKYRLSLIGITHAP